MRTHAGLVSAHAGLARTHGSLVRAHAGLVRTRGSLARTHWGLARTREPLPGVRKPLLKGYGRQSAAGELPLVPGPAVQGIETPPLMLPSAAAVQGVK